MRMSVNYTPLIFLFASLLIIQRASSFTINTSISSRCSNENNFRNKKRWIHDSSYIRTLSGIHYHIAPTYYNNQLSLLSLQATSKSNDQNIQLKEKGSVLLYRIALLITSLAYSLGQLINLLQDSGLSQKFVVSSVQTSNTIFDWAIIATALFLPSHREQQLEYNEIEIIYKNDGNDMSSRKENASFVLSLNQIIPKSALIVVMLKSISIFFDLSLKNFDETIACSFICALCFREIGYYGIAYKVEAILAILLSILKFTSDINDYIGISINNAMSIALALSLLVLSFGKVFEPLEDDLQQNGSQFFVKN